MMWDAMLGHVAWRGDRFSPSCLLNAVIRFVKPYPPFGNGRRRHRQALGNRRHCYAGRGRGSSRRPEARPIQKEGLVRPNCVFDAFPIFCRPLVGIFPMCVPGMEFDMFPEFRFSFGGKRSRTLLHSRKISAAIRVSHVCLPSPIGAGRFYVGCQRNSN